jgi:hypothetical protein
MLNITLGYVRGASQFRLTSRDPFVRITPRFARKRQSGGGVS